MKKFRIVWNGYNYKIQERRFVIFWKDLKANECFGGHVIIYAQLDDAEVALADYEMEYKRNTAKYKEVNSRRKTKLWISFYGEDSGEDDTF